MVKYPIRIHYTDISLEKWNKTEEIGKTIINQIERSWLIPDFILLFIKPYYLEKRILSRCRFIPPEKISKYDAILLIMIKLINYFYFKKINKFRIFEFIKKLVKFLIYKKSKC